MKNYSFLLLLILLAARPLVQAQEHFPANGLPDPRKAIYAFTNATIYVDPQTTLTNAHLLIQDGRILDVGQKVNIPASAITRDMTGKHIYPGFIDLHTNYGMPKPERSSFSWGNAETIPPQRPGPFNANDAIKADFNAIDILKTDEKAAQQMRAFGMGTVLTFRPDGAARGTGSLLTLGDDKENQHILKAEAAAHYAFDKGSSKQDYPVSIMGFVALLRQTYLDAQWYDAFGKTQFYDRTLDHWNKKQKLPQIFETKDLLNLFRADRLGDEFGVQYILTGNGDEYQRLDAIKATGATLILPLNFPDAYDVANPLTALHVSLAQLKHWELAPSNPAALAREKIPFALTTAGCKDAKTFFAHLQKAIQYGLPTSEALRALTTTPATLLGVQDQIGALRKGMVANFLIASGDLMTDPKARLHHNYIRGRAYEIEALPPSDDPAGRYQINDTLQLHISGTPQKPDFVLYAGNDTIKATGKIDDQQITLHFAQKEQSYRLAGWRSNTKDWSGNAQGPDGNWFPWQARYQADSTEKKSDTTATDSKKPDDLGPVLYPFMAYGTPELPQQQTILFKNATVWTNEAEGILPETDVLIRNGKIAQIGKNLTAPKDAQTVDATGMHLTSGVIDEHSHIALSSVNDVMTISSMVRMRDAVNPNDPSIYRQLAGGVTAAQLLHGSANPIGGQSAIIKLRWGATAEQMLIEGADPFIKFALGENVKRSWNNNSIRYPQTRMGVEQVYRSAFTQAHEYGKAWDDFRNKKTSIAPRRDLALDALLEIINSKRFISCHSYVQSEITMLMRVAEQFGFRVNTFTHILEGYKVADKMKAHGVGASSFADWWAYKFEVYEAIPYNPALMHEQGLVVAINSDDAEMGRRLNQEAAKVVKYGGVSEEEAWKMVTLNPAKLLHLDDRMGSIKVGKDGDVVLWSDHPLSIYAQAQLTLIDGKVYFDRKADQERRAYVQAERQRLTTQMLKAKSEGKPTQKPSRRPPRHFHCDDVLEHH
ncbi:MAG: amidohydrolase family protein [Bernardetiaceae bacterium]